MPTTPSPKSKFIYGQRVLAYKDNEPGVIIGYHFKYQGFIVQLDSGERVVVSEDNLEPEKEKA